MQSMHLSGFCEQKLTAGVKRRTFDDQQVLLIEDLLYSAPNLRPCPCSPAQRGRRIHL